jgi:hypothetical protein
MDLKIAIETVLKQYHFNLHYAEKLVADVPPELMSKSAGAGLENHPSFTLGHLATASAMTVEDLGGTYEVPGGWKELFQRKGPGDPRKPAEGVVYPPKNSLLSQLKLQHSKVETALMHADQGFLNAPFKWRFNQYFPTTFDLVAFMCISHEIMHLSQLSAWRRAKGLPSALAAM